MKIAIYVVNDNDKPRGLDRYCLELLKSLAALDHRNSYLVFYAPWQQCYPQALQASNVRMILLHPPRSHYCRIPWQAIIFPRILRRYEPDVLHLPYTTFIWQRRYRTVMTIHDLSEFPFPQKFNLLRAYARRIIARLAVRTADQIVAVSNYTKNEIFKILHIDKDKIKVVWEGVSQSDHRCVECANTLMKYGLNNEYFLYVGVIEKTKNIESIIHAFRNSQEYIQKYFNIVLVGRAGNAYNDVIGMINNYGLQEKVRYLGYVEEAELACLYKGAKAFIFPSLVEGFGLVVLEAMSYGIPVITSNVGAMKEVSGNAAFLVDPYNINDIKNAMEKIAFDKNLNSDIIERGKNRTLNFSWKRMAQDMIDIYNKVSIID